MKGGLSNLGGRMYTRRLAQPSSTLIRNEHGERPRVSFKSRSVTGISPAATPLSEIKIPPDRSSNPLGNVSSVPWRKKCSEKGTNAKVVIVVG